MSATFEQILDRDDMIVLYQIKGISMKPLLCQERDLVLIQVPSSRLRKNDVAVYKRGDAYVLHRVIRVMEDHYLIRGDNTYALEKVPDAAVIGVMTGFQRKGKRYTTEDRWYRWYVRFWNFIYPLRYEGKILHRFAARIARRVGLLGLIRKMQRKNSTPDKGGTNKDNTV